MSPTTCLKLFDKPVLQLIRKQKKIYVILFLNWVGGAKLKSASNSLLVFMFVITNTMQKILKFDTVNTKDEKYFQKLGDRIKKLIEAKDVDQKSFAFDCEIGRTQLYMIENGKTNPRLLTLMKIADGL